MRFFLCSVLLTITLLSCKNESKNKIDVSNIDANAKIARFDVDFYTANSETLPKIKEKYPMMFPHAIDSVWVNKINNKDEQELFAETQKVYKEFSEVESQLVNLFQHIKYYNPKFVEPTIITTLSNIDYENRVIYTGEFLIISLDVYMGENHEFYGDYPKYIRINNTKNHIIVDVTNAIISKQLKPKPARTFVAKMIEAGKKMYLLDVYLPSVSDKEKTGYSIEKYNWATFNEEGVWRFFIENDLLYSTDSKLNKQFLDLAPFSKFYLESDNETPGQIGVYIGWQIVRAYMQNNDVSLQQLMANNAEEIFKKSKYKPKR